MCRQVGCQTRLTLGVASPQHAPTSVGNPHLQNNGTVREHNTAGPLPSGAARELWLEAGRGCRVLGGAGGGRGTASVVATASASVSPSRHWAMFNSLLIRTSHVALNRSLGSSCEKPHGVT
jgi:hypothetical protein